MDPIMMVYVIMTSHVLHYNCFDDICDAVGYSSYTVILKDKAQ